MLWILESIFLHEIRRIILLRDFSVVVHCELNLFLKAA